MGIRLIDATNHSIYLNNFIDQPSALVVSSSSVRLDSPQPMAYTYNGTAQTGHMGNYYSDYNGTTSNASSNVQNTSMAVTSNQTSNGTGLPGFEALYAVAGLLIAALVVVLKHHR
jgi:PGF-CTERM protein